ncbi:MAG TPA: AAA family ATPase, partial [Acidimicrobiales bacterium]|nr:AAA family ATPase [Acidimicrobiales bacterium]
MIMLVNRDVGTAGDLRGCDADLRDPGAVGVATGVARIPDPAPTVGVASTPGAVLLGRQAECRTLDWLIEAVRGGQSRSLVVRGEAGVGKSALLEQAATRAAGCRIERAVGVQSELELPYAGLH